MTRYLASIFLCCLALGDAKSSTKALVNMVQTLSKNKVTPEVAETFKRISDTIKNELYKAVTDAHDWTQTHLDWYNADLTSMQDKLETKLTAANGAYDAVYTCRQELYAASQDSCTSCGDAEKKCRIVPGACNCVKNVTWRIDVERFGLKQCNLHEQHKPTDCDEIRWLDEDIKREGKKITDAYDEWVVCDAACTAAMEECKTQTEDCEDKIDTANAKRQECQGLKTDFDNAACHFGSRYQGKCYDYKNFQEFLYKAWPGSVNANEFHFSEEDRMKEWKTLQAILCILDSYDAAQGSFMKTLDTCLAEESTYPKTLNNHTCSLNSEMAASNHDVLCDADSNNACSGTYQAKATCGHSPDGHTWKSDNDYATLQGAATYYIFGSSTHTAQHRWVEAAWLDDATCSAPHSKCGTDRAEADLCPEETADFVKDDACCQAPTEAPKLWQMQITSIGVSPFPELCPCANDFTSMSVQDRRGGSAGTENSNSLHHGQRTNVYDSGA